MKKYLLLLIILLVLWGLNAKVGLALSGGGARAFAHIGVLKVLDQQGIKIDYISGTSTGALIASLYACGMSAEEIEELLLQVNLRDYLDDRVAREQKMINFKQWQEGSNISLGLQNLTPVLPEGIVPGNNLINRLHDMLWEYSTCTDFDSLSIPLRIAATDMIKGETKVFSSGHLHEAIFASFCFPTIFKPFALDNTYYIDGGILMNLPVEPLQEQGADYIVGVKANSPLKTSTEMNHIIDVLEQTAGVAITSNIKESQELCDLLIEPDLEGYSMLDFSQVKDIIAAGEIAAREALGNIPALPRRAGTVEKSVNLASRIYLEEISIEGNLYLDKSEIMSYLDLQAGKSYTRRQVRRSFARAYNTDLFEMFYPVIERKNSGYHLIVKVQEKPRGFFKMNLTYDTTKDISLRVFADYKNLLQANSRLICSVELSENNELCIDYMKRLGEDYGFYYHLYPYLKQIPIYTYNEDYEKTEKVLAIEKGSTAGMGVFFQRLLILEFYSFFYDKNLYRDIGSDELRDQVFLSWGAGAKLYFDTLDDLIFGTKGVKLLSKYTFAKSDDAGAGKYQKGLLKFEFLHPLAEDLSLRYKFEYGSYFDKAIPYDPFYIGGIDSFLGLHDYQRSSSIYKINSISLRVNPWRDLYVELLANNLNLNDIDTWSVGEELFWAGGVILGYKFPLIPVRAGLAISEDKDVTGYFNVGYSLDMFEFSRR